MPNHFFLGSNKSVACGTFTTANALGIWDGDTPGLANNAAVATWTDTGGASNTLRQATGGLQPIYKTNVLNGHNAVEFTAHRMTMDNFFAAGTTVSYFAVIKLLSTGVTQFVFGGADGSFALQVSDKQAVDKKNVLNVGVSNTSLTTGWQKISFGIASNNWAFQYGGAADGSGTTVTAFATNTSVVGAQESAGTFPLQAQLAFLAIYSTNTDMTNNNAVASCLYGV